MARIIKQIEIEGKPAIALFDTGAMHTYVTRRLLNDIPMHPIFQPYEVSLGGKTFNVTEICVITGKIEGLEFDTKIIPVENLGKANGYELDVIIGALTMEEWEIKLDPKTGELDLEGLRRREFTEY